MSADVVVAVVVLWGRNDSFDHELLSSSSYHSFILFSIICYIKEGYHIVTAQYS
jgi:hypothetical protein